MSGRQRSRTKSSSIEPKRKPTLYVTMMGENHGRMMAHLRPMRFFDAGFTPDNVFYLSAYKALEDEGIEGL